MRPRHRGRRPWIRGGLEPLNVRSVRCRPRLHLATGDAPRDDRLLLCLLLNIGSRQAQAHSDPIEALAPSWCSDAELDSVYPTGCTRHVPPRRRRSRPILSWDDEAGRCGDVGGSPPSSARPEMFGWRDVERTQGPSLDGGLRSMAGRSTWYSTRCLGRRARGLSRTFARCRRLANDRH